MKYGKRDISDVWCPDTPMPLDKLKNILTTLQRKYGNRAVLHLDAGYNNIIAEVEPTKKPQERKKR